MKNQHPFWQIIRTVPDFPKVGIDFFDVTPLFHGHINTLIDELLAALPEHLLNEIDSFVALEARGFVFASLLAARTNKNLTLIRKKGKLPPPVFSQSYALEYGEDTLEISANTTSQRVLLVDDVLATGGTLRTSVQLCKQAGHHVQGALVLLDLVNLHTPLEIPVYRVLTSE